MSLLPKYRGFSPLVNMLLNREKEIGVSALIASNEYDKGNIVGQMKHRVTYPIKIGKSIEIISKLYGNLMITILNDLLNNNLKEIPQNEEEATYSLWRNEDDYLIDWNRDANSLIHLINILSYPYKSPTTFLYNKKIRILEAVEYSDVTIENRNEHIGKVIFLSNKSPVIVCGKGLILIKKAIDDKSKKSVLPFENFRVRLNKNQ